MMFRSYRNLGVLAGSMVFTLWITQARGQTSTDPAGGLEEIIVTAERRGEDVQKTATAVAVRSGDTLQAEGKFTLQQMLEDVAGVTALPSSSNFNSVTSGIGITIRGAGAQMDRGGQLPRTGATLFLEARA